MYARTGGAGNNFSPNRRRLPRKLRRDGVCNRIRRPVFKSCGPMDPAQTYGFSVPTAIPTVGTSTPGYDKGSAVRAYHMVPRGGA